VSTLLHLAPETSVAQRRRFQWRGVVGGLILIPSAFLVIFSAPRIAEDSWQGQILNITGWAAFVAGAGLRFWATLYISGRKERHIVVDGPYSLCRHPLYIGSLLLAIAAGLFIKSVFFAAALLIVALVYVTATVPVEEACLRARHPLEFDNYARRVRRYLPSMRSFQTPEQISVAVHGLWLECARASRWIWLPVATLTLGQLRALPWWPHLFRIF
jgi:protein-S-isoprenylcysteine O-methyltransferase Ste14